MNIWDYIIIAAISVALLFALIKIIRNRKLGRSSCCGNCSGCSDCKFSEGKHK